MPAETHSHREGLDVETVLGLLAAILGADGGPEQWEGLPVADFGLDDDLALLHLWELAAEELGERSLGELDVEDAQPATLGELADLFHDALRGRARR